MSFAEVIEEESARPAASNANTGNKPSSANVVKCLSKVPYNEIAKMSLKVCIVDDSKTDLRISPEDYMKLDRCLALEIGKRLKDKSIEKMPPFDMSER